MCTIKENWSYEINLNAIEENNSTFDAGLFNIWDYISKIVDKGSILEQYNIHDAQNCDDNLRNVMESNKNLRQDIDLKVKDIQQQKNQYKTLINDQKLLSQEIKERHEAFLMAKKFNKKHLKIYYTIGSKVDNKQTIYVQFFTEAKKESDNYSVHLLRNLEEGKYKLLSTNPQLDNFKEIKNKMQELNDTSGALCCIRDHFRNLKASIKIVHKNK